MTFKSTVTTNNKPDNPIVLKDNDDDWAFENFIDFGSKLVKRVETQSSWAENQNIQSMRPRIDADGPILQQKQLTPRPPLIIPSKPVAKTTNSVRGKGSSSIRGREGRKKGILYHQAQAPSSMLHNQGSITSFKTLFAT
ncbi:hypothetical protein LguiB_021533 [Lonicera macranthoides]